MCDWVTFSSWHKKTVIWYSLCRCIVLTVGSLWREKACRSASEKCSDPKYFSQWIYLSASERCSLWVINLCWTDLDYLLAAQTSHSLTALLNMFLFLGSTSFLHLQLLYHFLLIGGTEGWGIRPVWALFSQFSQFGPFHRL